MNSSLVSDTTLADLGPGSQVAMFGARATIARSGDAAEDAML